MDIHKAVGEEFKLGCIPPLDVNYDSGLLTASSVPGFRVWSRNEIMDALQKKEKGRISERFQGNQWVFNQGQVGSCCPAATKGALRRTMALSGANEVPDLHHEFTYALCNRNQDGGALLHEVNKSVRDVGMPTARYERHPFNRNIFQRFYTPEDFRDAALYRSEIVFEITREEELATLILSGAGTAVIAVHVGQNFNNLNRDGFPGASPGVGNHAVGVDDVELINGKPAYHSFNSWGMNWGVNGCCYYDWDRHLATTCRNHRFFGIMSTRTVEHEKEAPLGVE